MRRGVGHKKGLKCVQDERYLGDSGSSAYRRYLPFEMPEAEPVAILWPFSAENFARGKDEQ